MVTARPQIRVGFPRRKRARHGIATISVRRSRPETGAAEFDRARGWLGLPRVLGAQLQGKGVALLLSAIGSLGNLPCLSSFSEKNGVQYAEKG